MADLKQCKERLLGNLEAVLQHLFPAGKIIGHEFRVGDVQGNPGKGDKGGSLAVQLRGADRGAWKDFAMGDHPDYKGDVIKLWCMARGQPLRDVLPEMYRFTGITRIATPAPKPKPPPPSKDLLGSLRGTPAYETLRKRGISDETMRQYRVRTIKRKSDWNEWFIGYIYEDTTAAPVMLKGRGINPKVERLSDGRVKQSKDIWTTQPYYTLWGWWLVPADCRRIGITEGEEDAMSVAQLSPGFPILSVPSGSSNFDWIDNDFERLEMLERIDFFGDMDEPGEACARTIALRLGRDRVWRVPIPAPHKDANAALCAGDPDILEVGTWIEKARTYDPPAIRGTSQCRQDARDWAARKRKRMQTSRAMWPELPFEFVNGELTIVSGYPDSGKSTWLYQCMIHEMRVGERVLFISFEIRAGQMLNSFAMAYTGHFPDEQEADKAYDWMEGRFWYYDTTAEPRFADVLKDMEYAARRFGITRFVLDSLFFLVAKDDYEGQDNVTRRLKYFTEAHNVAVCLVAHAIVKQSSQIVPGMEHVEGSGGLTKPIDCGLSIWRNAVKQEKLEEAEEAQDVTKREKAEAMHDAIVHLWKNREDGRHMKLRVWFDPAARLFRTRREDKPTPAAEIPTQEDLF